MVSKYMIEVPVVVAARTAQLLAVAELPLSPPADEIESVNPAVAVDGAETLSGEAIIRGRLMLKVAYKPPGEAQQRRTALEVPFSLALELDGVRTGDCCEVTEAVVAGDEYIPGASDDDDSTGLLQTKVAIRVGAKVTRPRWLTVTAADVTPEPTCEAGPARGPGPAPAE